MKRMRRGEAGAVLPLVALCLAALMGFAGMSVDVGYWEYQQREEQSAADGAAVGAAQQLLYTTCPNSSVATSAAKADATSNGYTDGTNNVQVIVNNPPTSGPYASDKCAVDVQVVNSGVPTWFTKLFGFNVMKETTEAVGTLAGNGNSPCIWFLTTSQQNDLSNSHINTPSCSIVMNTSANFSNSTVNAAYIGYASGTNNVSGATFENASPSSMPPVADPCAEMPGCEYLTQNPPSTSSCGTNGNFSNTTVPAGCYASLTLSGTDTLQSGQLYVVNGQFHVNGATVTGTDDTIYLTANASDTNYSNANLNVSAPTTGNYAGVAIFRPGSQSAAVDMSTCKCAFTGLVYFPTAKVNFSNDGNSYTVLVVGQGNLSNSTNLDFATPPPGYAIVSREAVLGQ